MTTDTTTELGTISRDDIAAMFASDSMTLHHLPTHLHRDGVGHMIRVYLRGGYAEPHIWTAREQRLFPQTHTDTDRMRTILVASSVMGYGQDGEDAWTTAYGDPELDLACFHSFYDVARRQTIAGILRPGDVLSLFWAADNNTEILRDAGLHSDSVNLIVRRGPEKQLVFRVGESVGRDNSARMIRRHG
ncbi:MAG: hypothetical protein ABWZ30_01070 [Jiangellaceae bacterium]